MAAIDKIFDLLDTEPDMEDAPGARDPGDPRRDRVRGRLVLLRLDQSAGLKRSSGQIEPVTTRTTSRLGARGRHLHVPAGETLALVGETGAGKSTLAKLVARFYDPQRGRVRSTGTTCARSPSQPARASSASCRRRASSSPGRCARTSPSAARARATRRSWRRADAVGAHDFIRRLPEGYDTEVGERGAALSAGQRQLIALARALIADPRILVLDEATANVDVHAEGAIEQGLRAAARGRTAIVIAHRLSTDPERGPDRRAGARPGGRDRHARRADRGRRPYAGSTGPGPNWPPPRPP